MSITTFADLIAESSSKKIYLVEISPAHLIENWVLYSGDVYRYEIGSRDISSVKEDSTTLTEVASIAAMSAGTWYYDGTYLYVQSLVDTPYDDIVVATYNMYFATEQKIFSNKYYEPLVSTIPSIKQDKPELFWGVSIISNGVVRLHNDSGFWDTIYKEYAWSNKSISVLVGGEDLPYSEYTKLFDGLISKKRFGTDSVEFEFADRKTEFENSLPFNLFSSADYPNLNAEDVGKPIPHVWGTVQRMPVICTNRDDSGTSTYSFKIADTSTHSINAISTVYVNGVSQTIKSSDTSVATFSLSSTYFNSGDLVAADIIGYQSGTTVLENPVDITRELGVLMGLTDSNWDTTARSDAKDDVDLVAFNCGLVANKFGPVVDLIGDLMKSCMGNFFVDNNGLYSIIIWSPEMEVDPDIITDVDIKEGSLKVVSKMKNIRKIVRCGYSKQWDIGDYAWSQKTGAKTEKLYGITRSRSVPTLLSTVTGAQSWLSRMILLSEGAINFITFVTKLQLAAKNIGDRFQISFKRKSDDSNITWLDIQNVEIQSIKKNLQTSEILVTVDDLSGTGNDFGRWTEDAPTFPLSLGGGSAAVWDSNWSDDQKIYAKSTWGFWTDSDGKIDPADESTLNKSRWW